MIFAVDSTTLVLLISPSAGQPIDPSTNAPVTLASDRVAHLLKTLGPDDTLIIPAPVLAEVLVGAGDDGPALLESLNGMSRVRIAEFGQRAAVELAAMTREAIEAGNKKGASTKGWQAVKFDRQIIAIARVERASSIYSDDEGLVDFAKSLGMDTMSTWTLPLPPQEDNLFTSVGMASSGVETASPEFRILPPISQTAGPPGLKSEAETKKR